MYNMSKRSNMHAFNIGTHTTHSPGAAFPTPNSFAGVENIDPHPDDVAGVDVTVGAGAGAGVDGAGVDVEVTRLQAGQGTSGERA